MQELLLLLLIKTGADVPETLLALRSKEAIIGDLMGSYKVTQRWSDMADNILLTSEKSIPRDSDLTSLVEKMMAIVPHCKKEGTAYYFKCNRREITLKLKKFFKLYGNYSDEDILEATQRYVDSFNGNYTYMKLLKYFILKDERKVDSEGVGYIEEVSMLATFLENKDAKSINFDNGSLV